MPPNILAILADNPALFEAVKAVLIKQFEVSLSTNMPNELLGQITRARIDGLNALERAFREIATYKSKSEAVDKVNPAR